MNEATPPSLLPYDVWTARALRSVALDALEHAAREGLPGEHHFFITFDTAEDGVEMADWLRARYPAEMTIVIQHRYWDLHVAPDFFTVGLSFGGVPAMLRVPFAAVTDFVDPAVDFSLKFQANAPGDEHEEHEQAENDAPAGEQAEDGSNFVSVDFTKKK